MSQVIDAFATSSEASALYGNIDASNIGGVIDSLYLALFNRAPDPAGRQFYIDSLAAGTFTPASIALAVLVGAQESDSAAIDHKLQVANEFTQQVDGRPLSDPAFGDNKGTNASYAGRSAEAAARAILVGVTADPATVLNPAQVTSTLQTDIAQPGDPILGGGGGGGDTGGGGGGPPPTPTFTVTNSSITPSDKDNSHTYTSGDTLTLKFSAAIDATKIAIGDLALSGGHSLGTGATLSPTTGTATDFVITLDADSTVAKSDTITIAKAKLVNSSATAASANVAFTVGAVETVAPTYASAALSGANKVVTLTYDENVVSNVADAAALKAAVTFAANGETFAALGANDTVAIVDGKLVVTFENALTGTTNEILVAASTLKDAAGNVLASAVNTAALSAADTTAPLIASGSFTEYTGGIGASYSTIQLVFNEDMQVSDLTGVTLQQGGAGANIATEISAIGKMVTIGTTTHIFGHSSVKFTFDKTAGNIADLAGNKPDLPTFYIGGPGNNAMSANSELTGVRMEGNAGNDNLYGSAHADTLIGGAGNDYISGSAGADRLTGGAGADIFAFQPGHSGAISGTVFDSILDYTAGTGGDVLYLGNAVVAGDASPVYVTGAINGEVTGDSVTAAISNGLITLDGDTPEKIDTLAEWLAVARLVVTADTHVAAFQLGGDTYVFQKNTTGDLLIKLDSVTGVTAVSKNTNDGTVVLTMPTPVPAITYSATKVSEVAANDGAITETLTITLANDTFTGANDAVLAGVIFDKVPAGLTAVVTKKSATTAELSFTGKAEAHANAQDITDLTVTLGNAAFTSGDASKVTGATKSDIALDFADPAPPATTFTVTEDGTTHAITFGGTATGAITLTTDGTNLTFVRGGITATTSPLLANLGAGDIPAVTLTAVTFATAGLAALLTDASATVNASGASADDLTALSTGIAKVAAGGITNLTVTAATQSDAETANLLGKATAATVVATSATATEVGHLVTNIANIAVGGITSITLTKAQATAELLGKAAFKDGSVTLSDAVNVAYLTGLSTAQWAKFAVDGYSLTDTLAHLQTLSAEVLAGASSYALTDAKADLVNLSTEAIAWVQAASNAADYDVAVPSFTSVTSNGNKVVLTFSEAIQKGSGNIVIKSSVDGSTVATIAVADAVIADKSLTVTLPTALTDGADYYIEAAAQVVKDTVGNDFAGITNPATTAGFKGKVSAFDVTLDPNLPNTYHVGTGNGAVEVTLPSYGYYTFTPEEGTAKTVLVSGGAPALVVDAPLTLTGTAKALTGAQITGSGSVTVRGSVGDETLYIKTTGSNTIEAGGGWDWVELGAGADKVVINGGTIGVSSDSIPSDYETIIGFDLAYDTIALPSKNIWQGSLPSPYDMTVQLGMAYFLDTLPNGLMGKIDTLLNGLGTNKAAIAFVDNDNTYVLYGDGQAGKQSSDIVVELSGVQAHSLGTETGGSDALVLA